MIIVMLALLGVFPVQSAPAGAVGTWVADYQGKTFVRLELRTTNNTLGGAIATGNVNVSKGGEIAEVTAIPATLTPLTGVTVNGASISFFRMEGDDNEHFRLDMLGGDQADLTLLMSDELLEELKDEGIPVPKPFRLRKVR